MHFRIGVNLCVHAGSRKLVAGAEEWSRRQGYRSIRVRTRIARQDAHSFYRACGYELEKTQHVSGS
ncbi:MAG: GNAT family N-acetyltransferase [Thermoanaerobaculia bacterium]